MPSFIASLATQLIFLGIAILFTSTVTDKTSIGGLPEAFFVLGGTGHYFFLPILISVLVWLVTYWMLKYTIFGHHLYAVGTNPKVAHISGISVNRIIMRIMILSGLFASIASIIITARNQVGISSLGDKMFITIIASVIVGGTSTSGGTGGVKQTLFGVLFITLLNNTMNLLGIGWYTIMLVLGFLILLSGIISFGVNNPNMSKIRGR
jgi:ribose transport system permease protein